MIIDRIKELFSEDYVRNEFEDTLKIYKERIRFKYGSINRVNLKSKLPIYITELAKIVKIRTLDVYIGSTRVDADFVNNFESGYDILNEYLEELEQELSNEEITDDDYLEVDIYLEKNINGVFPIFTLDFIDCYKLKIHDFIQEINSRVGTNKLLVYSPFFSEKIETSKIIYFNSFTSSEKAVDQGIDILKERNEFCTSKNFQLPDLLPEFFKVDCEWEEVNTFFEVVRTILSSLFIFSTSELKDDEHYKFYLYNYNVLSVLISFSCKSKVIYELYKWVYCEPEKAEVKLGLIQTQIHLFINNDSLDTLKQGILSAVKSQYKLYLKENLNIYLNEKEKVEKQVKENISENLKSISDFSSVLGKNLLGTVSFHISVILLGSIKGNAFLLFTREVTLISFGIILCSFLLLVSQNIYIRIKLNYHISIKKRIIDSYTDIFNKDDLKNITKSITGDRESKLLLKRSIITFSIFWILSIVLLTILTSVVGFYKSNLSEIAGIVSLICFLYVLIIINLDYWSEKSDK